MDSLEKEFENLNGQLLQTEIVNSNLDDHSNISNLSSGTSSDSSFELISPFHENYTLPSQSQSLSQAQNQGNGQVCVNEHDNSGANGNRINFAGNEDHNSDGIDAKWESLRDDQDELAKSLQERIPFINDTLTGRTIMSPTSDSDANHTGPSSSSNTIPKPAPLVSTGKSCDRHCHRYYRCTQHHGKEFDQGQHRDPGTNGNRNHRRRSSVTRPAANVDSVPHQHHQGHGEHCQYNGQHHVPPEDAHARCQMESRIQERLTLLESLQVSQNQFAKEILSQIQENSCEIAEAARKSLKQEYDMWDLKDEIGRMQDQMGRMANRLDQLGYDVEILKGMISQTKGEVMGKATKHGSRNGEHEANIEQHNGQSQFEVGWEQDLNGERLSQKIQYLNCILTGQTIRSVSDDFTSSHSSDLSNIESDEEELEIEREDEMQEAQEIKITQAEKERLAQQKIIQHLKDKLRRIRLDQLQQIKCLNALVETQTNGRAGDAAGMANRENERNLQQVQGQGQGGDSREFRIQKESNRGETESEGQEQLMPLQSCSPPELVKMAMLQKKIQYLNDTLMGNSMTPSAAILSDRSSRPSPLGHTMPPVNELIPQVAQTAAAFLKN